MDVVHLNQKQLQLHLARWMNVLAALWVRWHESDEGRCYVGIDDTRLGATQGSSGSS